MNINTSIKRTQASEPIKKEGLRFFDTMIITPAFGRKKELRLNRTRFEIRTSHEETKITASKIELKQIGADEYAFDLELINEHGTKDSEDAGRFLLRVKGAKPIWHNGNYVFEAFLKRGDEVHFSYNKIVFQEEGNSSQKEDLPFDKRIVESNISLLLEGETGTGKSFLAKKIHERSNQIGPFIHVNLSSFSLSLIESELFGHAKGAFTGAISEKTGALREANRGTLFLDEIDSLPYEIQTKLLLFLDSGVIRPVGDSREFKSEVRLICASGRNLSQLVDEGRMRKDFYFRISSGFKYSLKSLRDDRQRIFELCEMFSRNHNVIIEPSLLTFYCGCQWPGNARELLGHLHKKKTCAIGRVLHYDDVDCALESEPLKIDFEKIPHRTLREIQTQYCRKVFYESRESIKVTAEILGVAPATIRSILRKG